MTNTTTTTNTTEDLHVKHITTKLTFSFDVKSVQTVEFLENEFEQLRQASASGEIENLPVKQKVFAKLMLDAHAQGGLEQFAAALIQYCLRVNMNETITQELPKSEGFTVSPVKARIVLGN